MKVTGLSGPTLRRSASIAALVAGIALAGAAQAVPVEVKVTSLAPQNGTYLTPVWVGFHTGGPDIFEPGAAASTELERLAEDGNPDPLAAAFDASGTDLAQEVLGPALAPGDTRTATFDLDPGGAAYMSYAAMVIPSNDAFIANDSPTEHQVFDDAGNFVGADFVVAGNEIWDAGTEENTEATTDTAFFGQETPNTGPDENGTVMQHPGFNPEGSGGILDDPMFANADFTEEGYEVARITVTRADGVAVTEPNALWLLAAGLLIAGAGRRRAS